MAERTVEERMGVLEADVKSLAHQSSIDRTHGTEILDSRLKLVDERLDNFRAEVMRGLEDLKARKGEAQEDISRRLEDLERHRENHCDELEALRESSKLTSVGLDTLKEGMERIEAVLETRTAGWRDVWLRVVTGVALLAAGYVFAVFVGRGAP